jgi:ubiquinol-cytochrome c reductase core subunit 2
VEGRPPVIGLLILQNTKKRTAFRVTRETELLGGLLSSSSSRENVAVSAQCLREDIPYFLEALADVALLTNYAGINDIIII